jgi:hypothetical protein
MDYSVDPIQAPFFLDIIGITPYVELPEKMGDGVTNGIR